MTGDGEETDEKNKGDRVFTAPELPEVPSNFSAVVAPMATRVVWLQSSCFTNQPCNFRLCLNERML